MLFCPPKAGVTGSNPVGRAISISSFCCHTHLHLCEQHPLLTTASVSTLAGSSTPHWSSQIVVNVVSSFFPAVGERWHEKTLLRYIFSALFSVMTVIAPFSYPRSEVGMRKYQECTWSPDRVPQAAGSIRVRDHERTTREKCEQECLDRCIDYAGWTSTDSQHRAVNGYLRSSG